MKKFLFLLSFLFLSGIAFSQKTNVVLLNKDGSTLQANLERTLSAVLTEFNQAHKANRKPKLEALNVTSDGRTRMLKIWEMASFYCPETTINEYLIQFKQQCLTNHHSFPQPLYNAYEYYCGRCYATAKRRIISKRYFEKYFMEEYPDYIDENGMITIKWWSADADDDYAVDVDAADAAGHGQQHGQSHRHDEQDERCRRQYKAEKVHQ